MRVALYFLHIMTRFGYRIRGVARLCEKVRQYYIHHPKEFWTKDFDGNLHIKINLSEHIGSQIFWRGAYSEDQLEIVNNLLKPDDTFFDIGANIGEFTLFVAKRVPLGNVYSFEPAEELFDRLSSNVVRNDFANVHLFQYALSDKEGETELYEPTTRFSDGSINAGLHSLYGNENDSTSESVSVTTLDDFVDHQGLEGIDLIKMDIEGSELRALRGGARTLRRFSPKLIIEVNASTCRRAGYEQQDILIYLRTFGYRFQRIDPRGKLSACDENSLSDFQNIFCLPNGMD